MRRLSFCVTIFVLACSKAPSNAPSIDAAPSNATGTSVASASATAPAASLAASASADASTDASSAASSEPSPYDAAKLEEALRGIKMTDANHVTVTKRAKTLLADSHLGLLRARTVPEMVDGGVVGVRLFGIRQDGALAALAIRNGDRLEAIDDHKPLSIDDMNAALRKVAAGSAKKVVAHVNRAGKPVEITYELVP